MSVNIPATIYRNTNGLTEYSTEEANDLVDTLGINLVDTLGIQIVDTGVIATLIPSTTWEENDDL